MEQTYRQRKLLSVQFCTVESCQRVIGAGEKVVAEGKPDGPRIVAALTLRDSNVSERSVPLIARKSGICQNSAPLSCIEQSRRSSGSILTFSWGTGHKTNTASSLVLRRTSSEQSGERWRESSKRVSWDTKI